jgi:GT2 family glycosyltransferase
MLSLIVAVRNTRQLASRCLASVAATLNSLGSPQKYEVLLIDDHSDPEQHIGDIFLQFRQTVRSQTTLIHLKQRQFYTYSCSLGLSLAKGDSILFLSHDMVVPPAYIRMLESVASLNQRAGIVRGTSPHVDCLPQHVVQPPFPHRHYGDVCSFSEYVAGYYGTIAEEDRFLIGDSFLIKREVIEKIGVMDVRYGHLFGDLDFGVRARRAGFSLICAKGAWLHHEGAGHTKDRLASGTQRAEIDEDARQLIDDGIGRFREQWAPWLPLGCPNGLDTRDFERIQDQPRSSDEFAPLLKIDQAIIQLL